MDKRQPSQQPHPLTVNNSPWEIREKRWVTDPEIPFCILWEEERHALLDD